MHQPTDYARGGVPGTLSVAARDPETGALGVALTTGLISAGASVPFVSGRAAVLTQSFTNVSIGRNALALVEDGLVPDGVRGPAHGRPPRELPAGTRYRRGGRAFVHTGADCVEWCGHLTAPNHTVAENMLVGPTVVEAMSEAVETTGGSLVERLLAALRAGEDAGGDRRGSISAAIPIDAPEYHLWHDLRVDYDDAPVAALTALYERSRETVPRLAENAAEMLGDYPGSIVDFERRWGG